MNQKYFNKKKYIFFLNVICAHLYSIISAKTFNFLFYCHYIIITIILGNRIFVFTLF